MSLAPKFPETQLIRCKIRGTHLIYLCRPAMSSACVWSFSPRNSPLIFRSEQRAKQNGKHQSLGAALTSVATSLLGRTPPL